MGILDTSIVPAGAELDWAGAQYRDREAVVFDKGSMTFGEVETQSNRLSHALRGLGLETNDRIAFLLQNSPESLIAVFGAIKAALTTVALNARHHLADHLLIIRDCEPRVLVAAAAFQEVSEQIAEATGGSLLVIGVGWRPKSGLVYEELLVGTSSAFPNIGINPVTYITRISYTSGTTGQPKGVYYNYLANQLRQRNFYQSLEYAVGVTESMIHIAPLTHAAGNFLLPYYVRGARAIVLSRFEPEHLSKIVEREQATHIFMVPTMIRMFMDAMPACPAEIASLTRLTYGAAPASRALLEEALDYFGPILRQHYGMTEAPQPISVLYPHEHEERDAAGRHTLLETCGRPIFGIDVVCRNEAGESVMPGEIGEITVNAHGAGATGFWKRPDLEAELLRDGWYQSGDLGRFDERGYLSVVGRKKDMIISGGFNIYSAEVENVLAEHGDVAEAVVFGMPDDKWGEIVCVWIEPKPGADRPTEADIMAFSEERLSGYKKPRMVKIVETLPRNANGKVDRQKIREIMQNAPARA